MQSSDISDKDKKKRNKKPKRRSGERPHNLLIYSPNSEVNIYRSETSRGLKKVHFKKNHQKVWEYKKQWKI